MAHYSINIKLSIAVYILISILLVAVGWGNLHQLAPWEEIFNILIEQPRLPIVVADTPATGKEQKPVMKHEGRPSYDGGRNNVNRNNNNNYNSQEKLLGADSNFRRKIFEVKRNRLEQVANLKTANDLIKAR